MSLSLINGDILTGTNGRLEYHHGIYNCYIIGTNGMIT